MENRIFLLLQPKGNGRNISHFFQIHFSFKFNNAEILCRFENIFGHKKIKSNLHKNSLNRKTRLKVSAKSNQKDFRNENALNSRIRNIYLFVFRNSLELDVKYLI